MKIFFSLEGRSNSVFSIPLRLASPETKHFRADTMASFVARGALLAALFIKPSLAQGPDFGPPPLPKGVITPGCTLSSFTTPSWYIQDFQATSGDSSFGLVNRETNPAAAVSCQGSHCSIAPTKAGRSRTTATVSRSNQRIMAPGGWADRRREGMPSSGTPGIQGRGSCRPERQPRRYILVPPTTWCVGTTSI